MNPTSQFPQYRGGNFMFASFHKARVPQSARCLVSTCVVLWLLAMGTASTQTVPSGFTPTQYASTLASPTAMEFAPDGRLFVCQRGGQLRVIEYGVLLPVLFVTLPVDPDGERG